MAKETLLRSARELFYKYGIKSVSMDDIARLLGISKKTIYTHVENKKDLVLKVIQNFIEEEHKMVLGVRKEAENAIDEMTSIAAYVLNTMREIRPSLSYDLKKYHPQAWALIQKDHFDHIHDVIEQNIKRGIAEKYYRENIDPETYARLYVGMARSVMDPELRSNREDNYSYLFRHVINYHMHGIINDRGRKKIKPYLKKLDL